MDQRIPNPGPKGLRPWLIAPAAVYLFLIFLDILNPPLAYRIVPGPILYFAQIAALFPTAKSKDIDYRAEGWDCGSDKYVEIDYRPYFPIQADNKESRFSRAMFFYRNVPVVMRALSRYIGTRYASDSSRTAAARSASAPRLGGVRLVTLLDSIPSPSSGAARYRRLPVEDYPDANVEIVYAPSMKSIRKGCGDDSDFVR